MVIEITGLVVEASLFLLAINLIWGLKMSLQKRLLVLSAFGCRLVYHSLPGKLPIN